MRVTALCLALFTVGCAHAHNYLDSDAPFYEGTLAVAPESLEGVRVVSFNIEYALRVPAAIDALRSQPALRDADLLLLQEMDAPGTESIARALGMNYVYCPSSVSPKYHRDVGTAVLSRWPIEARWKVRLPHLARATRHARSVVGVRVRLGPRSVRVYSVHFGTIIGLSPSQRRDQLAAVVEDARGSVEPVIIGGDFNSKGLAERLAGEGFDWPTRDVGRTIALGSFDHILTRGLPRSPAPTVGVAREVKGVSDHFPVWALLALPPDAAALESGMLRAHPVATFLAAAAAVVPATHAAERSPLVRPYVSVDAPTLALTHVRVIDGTGAPAAADQTVLIANGRIQAVGAAVAVPPDAKVLDLSGRTVYPGLVMLHEHMFYPAGENAYNQQEISFPRLYLAGGVTTMRTGGSLEPYTDLNIKKAIDEGTRPGPAIHVTGPYIEGPGLPILSVKALRDTADARRMVEYWSGEGATSFKTYMHVTRDQLRAVVEEAHARGHKVTGHLCSVTLREAASMGIDNLEHGFVVATDFVKDKKPDTCPESKDTTASLLALDPDGPEAAALVDALVAAKVAITSTLPVFETLVPGRPPAPDRALDALLPEVRDQYLRIRARIAVDDKSPWSKLFEKEMRLERTFAARGGLLVAGTDPTGYGGVVPGFANQRQLELLVEAGFSGVEAIRIGTLNGARYLGIDDRVGSIAAGKQADLVVVEGDPSQRIADVEKVETVFREGVGYDPKKLVDSVKGVAGLR